MRSPRALSSFIAGGFAAVTLLAIALQAGCRHAGFQGSIGDLLLESLPATAALGAAGLLCWSFLRRAVLGPLERIHLHLHDVGLGRLRPLPLRSGILEIQSLIDGANLMVHRLGQDAGRDGLLRYRENLESLREVARSIASDSPEGAAEVLRDVSELEKALFSAVTARTMDAVHV